jgi:hypothetical protein
MPAAAPPLPLPPQLILFIMVPPAKWRGGYPCFLAALACIIGIVYLVNEAGSLFGCIVGLKVRGVPVERGWVQEVAGRWVAESNHGFSCVWVDATPGGLVQDGG